MKFTGNRSAVKYTVTLGDLAVEVDWNETRTLASGAASTISVAPDNALFGLVRGVSEAVGVWFNLTGKMKCFDHVEMGRQLGAQSNEGNEKVATTVGTEAKPRVCGASYAHHSKTGASSILAIIFTSSNDATFVHTCSRRVLGRCHL